MAYNEKLASRIRLALSAEGHVAEQPKFGGVSFNVNGKMCVRAQGDDIMLCCEPAMTDELLTKKGVTRFEMKGKPMMRGWLLISPDGTAAKKDFDFWIRIALEYNKKLAK